MRSKRNGIVGVISLSLSVVLLPVIVNNLMTSLGYGWFLALLLIVSTIMFWSAFAYSFLR